MNSSRIDACRRALRNGHKIGYNRDVDMPKGSLYPWGEIKRGAPRYEEDAREGYD